MDIKFADILMIVAVLASPLVALQVQMWLERFRLYEKRQHEVFRMLMATRGSRLSPSHIDALNRIDLEFYGRRFLLRWRMQTKAEKDVIKAWRAYNSNLSEPMPDGDPAPFIQRRFDLFITLLHAISQTCGYDFDQTHLHQMSYTPAYFGNLEQDQTVIRESLVKILQGAQPIPVTMIVSPEALAKQTEIQNAYLSQLGSDGVLRVKIIQDDREPSARPASGKGK